MGFGESLKEIRKTAIPDTFLNIPIGIPNFNCRRLFNCAFWKIQVNSHQIPNRKFSIPRMEIHLESLRLQFQIHSHIVL